MKIILGLLSVFFNGAAIYFVKNDTLYVGFLIIATLYLCTSFIVYKLEK